MIKINHSKVINLFDLNKIIVYEEKRPFDEIRTCAFRVEILIELGN